MIQKKKSLNLWFIVILLTLVSILVWFFVELTKTKQMRNISQVDLETAKSLEDNLDIDTINGLVSRLVINEVELAQIKNYAQKVQELTPQPNMPTENLSQPDENPNEFNNKLNLPNNEQ